MRIYSYPIQANNLGTFSIPIKHLPLPLNHILHQHLTCNWAASYRAHIVCGLSLWDIVGLTALIKPHGKLKENLNYVNSASYPEWDGK